MYHEITARPFRCTVLAKRAASAPATWPQVKPRVCLPGEAFPGRIDRVRLRLYTAPTGIHSASPATDARARFTIVKWKAVLSKEDGHGGKQASPRATRMVSYGRRVAVLVRETVSRDRVLPRGCVLRDARVNF